MSLDTQDIRVEDVEELRNLLAPYDQKIQLPDSLKGENLLKLLPEEEVKPEKTWITWLLSSSAAPILSAAAVLVLAVIMVPRVLTLSKSQENLATAVDVEAPLAAYSQAASSNEYDQALPEAGYPVDVNESAMGADAYGGEDLSEYAQDSTQWPASSQPVEEEIAEGSGFVGGQGASAEKEAAASEVSTLGTAPEGAAVASGPMPKLGGGAADSPTSSSTQQFYVAGNDKYNVFTRPIQEEDTQFTDSTQVLMVKDQQENLVGEVGLKGIELVFYATISPNEIALVGGGATGTVAQVYSGLSIPTPALQLKASAILPGAYLEGRVQNGYLYGLSTLESADQVRAMEQLSLKDSQGDGALVVTSLKLSDGTKKEQAIVGLDSSASFALGETALTMYYTQEDGKDSAQEFTLSSGGLIGN